MTDAQLIHAVNTTVQEEEGLSLLSEIVLRLADILGKDIDEDARLSNTSLYKQASSKLKGWSEEYDGIRRGKVGRYSGYAVNVDGDLPAEYTGAIEGDNVRSVTKKDESAEAENAEEEGDTFDVLEGIGLQYQQIGAILRVFLNAPDGLTLTMLEDRLVRIGVFTEEEVKEGDEGWEVSDFVDRLIDAGAVVVQKSTPLSYRWDPPIDNEQAREKLQSVLSRTFSQSGRDISVGYDPNESGPFDAEDMTEEEEDEASKGTPVDEVDVPDEHDVDEQRKVARQQTEEVAQNMRQAYENTRGGMIDRAQEEIGELPTEIDSDQAAELARITEMRASLHADGVLIQRFLLGVVARRMKQSMSHGESPMEQLSDTSDIHVNTIRECRRLAVAYDDNIKKFDRTLISINERKGRPARWTDIQTLIRSDHDPTVLGADALAERIIGKTERLAEQMDKASGSQEADGAIENLSDSAERFREKGLDKMEEAEQEDGFPRNEEYLNFVRSLDCVATGEPGPNEPHHITVGGGSNKGSDYLTIPLCHDAHMLIEGGEGGGGGIQKAIEKYGFDPIREALVVLHRFVSNTDYRPDLPIYSRPDEVKSRESGEVSVH